MAQIKVTRLCIGIYRRKMNLQVYDVPNQSHSFVYWNLSKEMNLQVYDVSMCNSNLIQG